MTNSADESLDERSPLERVVSGNNVVMATPEPLHVNTVGIIAAGALLWLVALVVTLIVPSLHHGSRAFWPWTCLIGAAFGGLGVAYVRRGRGNAKAA